jgi:hypothetical protein
MTRCLSAGTPRERGKDGRDRAEGDGGVADKNTLLDTRPNTSVPPAIVSVADAAAVLGVTKRQLYSWVSRGAVPADCHFRSGRAVWFIRARLCDWAGIGEGGTKE